MSDVSAVLVSMGEPFTTRALASIRAQTETPAEVVSVNGVSPFHRALNEGARQVTSTFFVQVDADMVLDPDCFGALRALARTDTGIVVGSLRDPMLGRTTGVKLLRTECFRVALAPDSISPDTDFARAISRHGYRTIYADREREAPEGARTFGDHLPDYTPMYTWAKYNLEGGRLRYRGARGGLRSRLVKLEQSVHPQARLAIIALARGFFRAGDRDGLGQTPDAATGLTVAAMLSNGVSINSGLEPVRLTDSNRLSEIFTRSAERGCRAGEAAAGNTIVETLTGLASLGDGWRATVAKVAFAHGVASGSEALALADKDAELLRRFLTSTTQHDATRRERVVAALRYTADGILRKRSWRW